MSGTSSVGDRKEYGLIQPGLRGEGAVLDASVFNSVPHMIWTATPDGETEFISERGAAQTGTDAISLRGWGWLRLLHPDDVHLAREVWQESIVTGRLYRNEYRVRQADDSFRWFLTQATPVRDSKQEIIRWIGTWTDIHDLKLAQLRNQRNEMLLANVRDSIIATDLDCVITFWNKGAENIFGWSEAEMLGHPVIERYPLHSREEIAAAMQAIFEGREWSGEYEDYRKDGSRVWIDARVTVLRDERGAPLGLIGLCHDISERKEFEREREQLIAVIEACPDFIGIADANQRATYVNPAGKRLVGLKSDEEVNQTHIGDYFSPDEWNKVESSALSALRDQGRWDGRVMFRNFQTGQEIPVRWNPFKTTPAGGGAEFYACVARDLTKELADEESIWASERRFRAFMEHSPVGAWITDSEGQVIYMNDRLPLTSPHLSAEDIGKTAFDLHPPDLAQVYRSRIDKVFKTGLALSGIEPGPREDGTLGEHMVYRFPIPSLEGKMCVGGVSFDVTDQRRTELALRLRDRAIQAVAQGITITDAHLPDNPIIYASPGFLKLTGYAETEVLGKNCRFLCGLETDGAARQQLHDAIQRQVPETVEILNYRRDGSQFWNQVSIAPILDDCGELTHFVGVQTDITERRRLEKQIRDSQRLEAVGQLAGGVAHDFNNLLTVVSAYCDLLLKSDSIVDKDRECLQQIAAAGERATDLTRQLLAFSKSQVLASEVTDLNSVIRQTENMLRRVIGATISINTELASDLKCVTVDPNQVSQVILNLAINARDAMPDGGVLRFETKNIWVTPDMIRGRSRLSSGEYALMIVSDTGLGMQPEVESRIFEPFFSTKETGSGLGLSVVHGVISQCGGFVTVESRPREGATFRIYLPVTDQAAPLPSYSEDLTALPGGQGSVMVVEDEQTVRQLSCRILCRCGYRVLEASDAESALRQLRAAEQIIDLLLTDLVMPGMDGQRLSDISLAEGLVRRTLLVTGNWRKAGLTMKPRDGQGPVLLKPFSPAALARRVRDILDDVYAEAQASSH